MIDLVDAEFTLETPPIGRDRLERYANALFSVTDVRASNDLPFSRFALRVEIEEGSVKGRTRICVAAATFYGVVSGFGSFVDGIEKIAKIGHGIASYFVEAAPGPLGLPREVVIRPKLGAGVPGKLRRLFANVQRGSMTPEQATALAMQILEGEEMPTGLRDTILGELFELPRNEKQLSLEFHDEWKSTETTPQLPSPRRKSQQMENAAILEPERWRIEIWRDEGKGERRVRVIPM